MNKEIDGNYRVLDSGRVKAAGVSFDPLFQITDFFNENPSPEAAQRTTEFFTGIRHNPPKEVRDRFFPKDRSTVKSMTKGSPALLRPILKTDQGAGQFLPFEMNGKRDSTRSYQISAVEGHMVLEQYFAEQLEQKSTPEVRRALNDLQDSFAFNDIDEARLAYERLEIACGEAGIELTRNATVGREGLFFIRPAKTREVIAIDQTMQQGVSAIISELSLSLEERVRVAKVRFAEEYGLPVRAFCYYPPLYFQADIQPFPDGNVVLDQAHFPDVGLFLPDIPNRDNETLRAVQERVQPLREQVVRKIVQMVLDTASQPQVFFITRPEVLEKQEDVLEIMEIAALQHDLMDYGIHSKVITPKMARSLESGDMALLMNVDKTDEGFERLLRDRLVDDRVAIYPDPFIKLIEDQLTGYEQIPLGQIDLYHLHAIVDDIEQTPNKLFRQLLALDSFLRQKGIDSDALHMHVSSQQTPIPCLRHDVKSFQLALKAIQTTDVVTVRPIPLSRNNAVLFDAKKQPIYSVFRFMAIGKGGV